MNFEDFFRQSFSDKAIYDYGNDQFLFRGKTYSPDDDEDDDLAYLGTDDRFSELMRDIKREEKPSDIERMENLLWDTLQAFLDFKKKLP